MQIKKTGKIEMTSLHQLQNDNLMVLGNISEFSTALNKKYNQQDLDKLTTLVIATSPDIELTLKSSTNENKQYNTLANLANNVTQFDRVTQINEEIESRVKKIGQSSYIIHLNFSTSPRLYLNQITDSLKYDCTSVEEITQADYKHQATTTIKPHFDKLLESINLEISSHYLQSVFSNIDNYILETASSIKLYRRNMRRLCEIMAFHEDLPALHRKLWNLLKNIHQTDRASSTFKLSNMQLRQTDAILFLLHEFTHKTEIENLATKLDNFVGDKKIAFEDLPLLFAGLNSSFLKAEACISISENLKDILERSSSNDAKSLLLIYILLQSLKDQHIHNDNELNKITSAMDDITPSELVELARRLRRVSPKGFANIELEAKALEYLQRVSNVTAARDEILAKCLTLFYFGYLGVKTLNYLLENRDIYKLTTEDLNTLSALSGFEVPYLTSLNKNLYSQAYSQRIYPTSKHDDILDYFQATLSQWEKKSTEKINKRPLVTIILTTYNPDLSLLKCSIQSLLLQTYKNIEIVLIDDSSTNEISQEIANYVETIKRTTTYNIIHKRNSKNSGQYTSRNTAIALSSGEYIAIQDDDDLSHPEKIEKQVSCLERNPDKRACHSLHMRISDNAKIMLDGNKIGNVLGDAPVSFMWRRSVFDDIGGFLNIKTRGDIEFRTRLRRHYNRNAIEVINLPLVYMRGGLTTVSSQYEYFYFASLQALRKIMSKIPYDQDQSFIKNEWIPTLLK